MSTGQGAIVLFFLIIRGLGVGGWWSRCRDTIITIVKVMVEGLAISCFEFIHGVVPYFYGQLSG